MGGLPEQHYISSAQRRVVLVWNFPPLINKWVMVASIILSSALAVAILDSVGPEKALLFGVGTLMCINAFLFLAQFFRNTDRTRSALILDNTAVSSENWIFGYNASWNNIKKIELISAIQTSVPQPEFMMMIYGRTKLAPIIRTIPKLTVVERQMFIEIFGAHCKQNAVKFSID